MLQHGAGAREIAETQAETLALGGLDENALDVPVACITFGDVAIMTYHQPGLLWLAHVALASGAVVTFKQALAYGRHAGHGVLELIEVLRTERMEVVPSSELLELLQELEPFGLVWIFHALAEIVAKKQQQFGIIGYDQHSGTIVASAA